MADRQQLVLICASSELKHLNSSGQELLHLALPPPLFAVTATFCLLLRCHRWHNVIWIECSCCFFCFSGAASVCVLVCDVKKCEEVSEGEVGAKAWRKRREKEVGGNVSQMRSWERALNTTYHTNTQRLPKDAVGRMEGENEQRDKPTR